jgi:hypothetical protein
MYSSRSRRVKQLNSICLLLPESALRWSYMAVELSTTPIQMCSSARRMQSSLAAESSGCRHNPSVTSALPGLLPGKHSMVFPLAIRALSKCEGNFRFAICARSKDSLAILNPPVILREVRRKPNAVEGPPCLSIPPQGLLPDRCDLDSIGSCAPCSANHPTNRPSKFGATHKRSKGTISVDLT